MSHNIPSSRSDAPGLIPPCYARRRLEHLYKPPARTGGDSTRMTVSNDEPRLERQGHMTDRPIDLILFPAVDLPRTDTALMQAADRTTEGHR